MNNKKLMQILLRDAGEMEKLISEIREAGSFDPLDMELLQSRISGICQLLKLASDREEVSRPFEETVPTPSKEETVPVKENITDILPKPAEIQSKNKKERKPEKSAFVEAKIDIKPEPVSGVPRQQVEETFVHKVTLKKEPDQEINMTREDKHILAEKFTAGKSINDLLVEKSKSDSKFTLMPLSSLSTGIGTNERFLFTRELFNGDMDHFNETIRTLDNMQTIHEATGYLRENFTWDKNETSLRFIELIKRRFTRNE